MTLPNPIHYWSFNEGSGDTAADSVCNEVISLRPAIWDTGRVGNAIRFAGNVKRLWRRLSHQHRRASRARSCVGLSRVEGAVLPS